MAVRDLTKHIIDRYLASLSKGKDFNSLIPERRLYGVLRMEAVGVFESVCNLEKLVEAALTQPVQYTWPWQWFPLQAGGQVS